MAFAVVQEQLIRLSIFLDVTVVDDQPIAKMRRNDQFSADHINIHLAAIADVVSPVVRDVEVQRPVAIYVG